MKRFLCVFAALLLLVAAARAEVVTTGSVNLRETPGLDGAIVGSVGPDTALEDLGGTSTDDRGVDWYQVRWQGTICWVSSVYSQRTGAIGDGVELSAYYGKDLAASAGELKLTEYSEDLYHRELPYEYRNGAASVMGYDTVEYIGLRAEGYMLFGAAVGMDLDEVAERLTAAGLELTFQSDNTCVFEHRGTPPGGPSAGEYDSCVNVGFDEAGLAREFDWSTYTY